MFTNIESMYDIGYMYGLIDIIHNSPSIISESDNQKVINYNHEFSKDYKSKLGLKIKENLITKEFIGSMSELVYIGIVTEQDAIALFNWALSDTTTPEQTKMLVLMTLGALALLKRSNKSSFRLIKDDYNYSIKMLTKTFSEV